MGEGGGEMHKTHSVLWATVNDINHTSSSATLKNKCGEIHCLSYCQQKKYQSQTILFHWCRSLSNMYREKLMRINKVHNHNNHSHTFIDRFCIKLNLMRSHLWSMEIKNFFLKNTCCDIHHNNICTFFFSRYVKLTLQPNAEGRIPVKKWVIDVNRRLWLKVNFESRATVDGWGCEKIAQRNLQRRAQT